MSARILGEHLLAAELGHEPLTGDEVVSGAPSAAVLPLGSPPSADGVEVELHRAQGLTVKNVDEWP